MGSEEYAVPWNKLTYDTSLGGYRTDITEREALAEENSFDLHTGRPSEEHRSLCGDGTTHPSALR